ncbi:SCO2524 family protein [Rhizomonospora bruguierae]|uniref:SCO2524 family protein n=1 Tax=Rhizomonospora bruguierae TaxID=1581705 RepID=UPI0020BF0218|nr:SCO2524 family protein [Micromonospora sp. NBRC 107566]
MARSAVPAGGWSWGGRHGRNSISDAEQLLCLLGPATEIPSFKLDQPDETADDVLDALAELGDSVEIPRLLVRRLTEYFSTYTDDSKTPVFSGGTYFAAASQVPPTAAQRALDVVDSFSVAIRLSLATIGFTRVFRTVVRRPDLVSEVDALESMASRRLSAAMVGLLRSFSVDVFDVGSPEGQALLETVNQQGLPTRQVVESLHRELRQVKAGVRDITLGSGQVTDIDNDNKLFQCGWSWGLVANAPKVDTTADVGEQRDGVAQSAPYLYFTVVALDCIRNLFSERTRLLGLLDEEQNRLSRSLQLRWDLTQSYWSKVGRFGSGRWPLEDLPWRTVDKVDSDYLSLLVTSIVVQDLTRGQPTESEVQRVGEVLAELAQRARITRRPLFNDPALALHSPGFRLALEGTEAAGGERLHWLVADFSPLLLKQTVLVAQLLRHIELRGQVVTLADRTWEHLRARRFTSGQYLHLWDQTPGAAADQDVQLPSWYYTERVVESLIAAAGLVGTAPLRSQALAGYATDLLAEADHLFDQELLSVSAEAGPAMSAALHGARSTLRRAHELMGNRPGTAAVLAAEVLRELDRLAAARQKATGPA